jgi:hypothetical protein
MSKPRICETEVVESLHPDFAPVGTRRHVTPAEAAMLVQIGRAKPAAASAYMNREMRTTVPAQPSMAQRRRHHPKRRSK